MSSLTADNPNKRSRLILQTICHLVIFAIALTPFFVDLPTPQSAIMVDEMSFIDGQQAYNGPRTLPDNWRHNESINTMRGFYETTIQLDETPDTLWGVFFPEHRSNLSIVINDVYVGDGGPFEPIVARNYMQPLMLNIPAGLLKKGDNHIKIELRADPAGHGFLGTFYVGPFEALRGSYNWHVLFLHTFVQIIVFAMFVLAIIMAVLWFFQRSEPSHGMLAGMAFTWALHTLNHAVSVIPVPLYYWDKMMMLAAVWTAIFGYFFINWYYLDRTAKLTGLERKTYGKPILIFSLVMSVVLVFLPMNLFYTVGIQIAVPLQVVLLCYMLVQMVNVARHSIYWADHLLTGIAFLGVVYPGHDAFITIGLIQDHVYYISAYFGFVAFFFFGSTLLQRFIENARSLETANKDLSEKIAERESELYSAFERQKDLERRSAREREREVIMRDIHDGLGGQLVSILSVVEGKQTSEQEVADALRGALDELRFTINSMDTDNQSLSALLALFRERILSRYENAGLGVNWDVNPTDLPPSFSPSVAQHILRILQEALTNAIKHSGASEVTICLKPASAGHTAELVFSDNGKGFDTSQASYGFGLNNMKSRAAEKNLTITIDSAPGEGTSVRVLI